MKTLKGILKSKKKVTANQIFMMKLYQKKSQTFTKLQIRRMNLTLQREIPPLMVKVTVEVQIGQN